MQKTQIDPDTLNREDWNSLRCEEAKPLLKKLYIRENMTQQEIADKTGVSQHHVSVALREHGIDTRDVSDYIIHPFVGYHPKGYIEARCQSNGNSDRFYLHRLLVVAEYGFDAVKGMDVHHKNGIGWDNRPENIELLSPSDHYSMERKKELENGVDLEARLP